MKTIEDKIDNAVHAAFEQLDLSVDACPDLADSLNDWLTEQMTHYTHDEDDEEDSDGV